MILSHPLWSSLTLYDPLSRSMDRAFWIKYLWNSLLDRISLSDSLESFLNRIVLWNTLLPLRRSVWPHKTPSIARSEQSFTCSEVFDTFGMPLTLSIIYTLCRPSFKPFTIREAHPILWAPYTVHCPAPFICPKPFIALQHRLAPYTIGWAYTIMVLKDWSNSLITSHVYTVSWSISDSLMFHRYVYVGLPAFMHY